MTDGKGEMPLAGKVSRLAMGKTGGQEMGHGGWDGFVFLPLPEQDRRVEAGKVEPPVPGIEQQVMGNSAPSLQQGLADGCAKQREQNRVVENFPVGRRGGNGQQLQGLLRMMAQPTRDRSGKERQSQAGKTSGQPEGHTGRPMHGGPKAFFADRAQGTDQPAGDHRGGEAGGAGQSVGSAAGDAQ